MEFLVSNTISALVGVVVGEILDQPIKRIRRRFVYMWRRITRVFRRSDSIALSQSEFHMGRWHAGWVVVEGSSSDPYTVKNTICQYDPVPLLLPPDRKERKAQIEQEQSNLERTQGRRIFHNGPTLALSGIRRGQIGEIEEPLLVLRLQPSDYYTFMATARSLYHSTQTDDGKTITVFEKHLRNLNYVSPIPEFASAFAVQTSLITSDGFIVVSKRAIEGVDSYPGHLAPAINECINPESDRDAGGTISLYATARRGASHELNIEITEDELVFFTVGVDIHWYMYTITGLVRSKSFTRDDILGRRSLGSKEAWEAEKYYFLPHDPFQVAKFMRDISATEKWAPYGLVCLIQTLVSEFGIRVTERALNKYPPL